MMYAVRSIRSRCVGCGVAILAMAACGFAFCTSALAQQVVEAKRFVVASGHQEATAIGVDVLRNGGNVVDAAVAVSLALGVAEPCGSGLGGKLVMLYREAATRKLYCVQACCQAPAELDAAGFIKLPEQQRRFGYSAAAVPGLPAGLWEAHQRWGSHTWRDLVQPAAELAKRGVKITEGMRKLFAPDDQRTRHDPEACGLFLADGQTLPAGSLMRNPGLAETLRRLGENGVKEFYEGETAQRIVAAARTHGSALQLDDLRKYQPEVTEPLSAQYRGHRIFTSPPPQIGGITLLSALKALEKHPWDQAKPRNASYVDAIGRVLLSVYPRVEQAVADFPAAQRSAKRLLSSTAIEEIVSESASIDPKEEKLAERLEPTADDFAEASTSHLVVADAQGNIVSLTQSLSYHFGAGVVVPGTGILLNNSLSNFSVAPSTAVNLVAPGKRPRSTIAPVIVMRGDEPVLALGIPGGQRIPTTTIQLIVDVLEFNLPLPEAVQQPRFHVRRPLHDDEPANVVDVEGRPDDELRQQLVSEGWRVVTQRRNGHYFGGGNAVAYQTNGMLLGVADLRRNNLALGD